VKGGEEAKPRQHRGALRTSKRVHPVSAEKEDLGNYNKEIKQKQRRMIKKEEKKDWVGGLAAPVVAWGLCKGEK